MIEWEAVLKAILINKLTIYPRQNMERFMLINITVIVINAWCFFLSLKGEGNGQTKKYLEHIDERKKYAVVGAAFCPRTLMARKKVQLAIMRGTSVCSSANYLRTYSTLRLVTLNLSCGKLTARTM